MAYTLRGLIFDGDALVAGGGLTLLVPAEPRHGSYVTMRERPVEGGVEPTLRLESAELARTLPGCKLVERTSLTLAGRTARLFEHRGLSADGVEITHRQAYLFDDEAAVVLTAVGWWTSRDEVREVFETLLSRVRPA